ncbi:MAG TPA: dihydrodipicolinate synthase family protein [Bryobacteraceae bacterium]|nr:dihydrodipicolinate synthase family protein [Bryobacteraceae bacterium]
MTRIQGVNAAAVTPHGAAGRGADFGAALELVDFVSKAGVAGIAVLGSTGEFLTLSFDERVRLMYLVVKRSRVPVLAGVGHATLEGALELGRQACSAGAAGLLLMPPYFFRYGQDEIREFYTQYAAQAGTGVPVYIYNVPAFTSGISSETAVELLATGRFAGIKDSSGSYEYFAQLKELAAQHPFTLLVGDDALFTRARMAGADGVVSGTAAAIPELMVALDRAIAAGAADRIAALEARLQEFLAWTGRFPTPVTVKTAIEARGLKVGPPTLPLAPRTVLLLDEFRAWFGPWLAELNKEIANV